VRCEPLVDNNSCNTTVASITQCLNIFSYAGVYAHYKITGVVSEL